MQRSIVRYVQPAIRWLCQSAPQTADGSVKLSTGQANSCRPTIQIAEDKFQITLDVQQFSGDELKVKARPEYVVIEGKQQRKLPNGYMVRQFVRKFKLPSGCDPANVTSTLSQDGCLTVTALRAVDQKTGVKLAEKVS